MLVHDPENFARKTLEGLGIDARGLAPAHGWSNSVWLSAEYVVRLSSGRFRDAYMHEAAVLGMLPEDVPHARVVAAGRAGRQEWMVQERVAGVALIDAWPELSNVQRRGAVEQLGHALRVLHSLPVPVDFRNPWLDDALAPGGHPEDAYHAPPWEYERLLAAARERSDVDRGLLDAAGAFIAARIPAFDPPASRNTAIVHCDLHWSNLMWDADRLTAVLDFEGSRLAAPDQELDTLLRFVREPALYAAPGKDGGLDAETLRVVPDWLAAAYPELFAHPRLAERLEAYEAMWQLVQIFHFPRDAGPRDPWARLTNLLTSANSWAHHW